MAENFMDTIIAKMNDLKSLQINTIVGDFEIDTNSNKIVPDSNAKMIVTNIDLLEGDITTAFSDEFLKSPLNKVREFHAEREKQGHQIINDNIKALSELINLVVAAIKGKDDAGI